MPWLKLKFNSKIEGVSHRILERVGISILSIPLLIVVL